MIIKDLHMELITLSLLITVGEILPLRGIGPKDFNLNSYQGRQQKNTPYKNMNNPMQLLWRNINPLRLIPRQPYSFGNFVSFGGQGLYKDLRRGNLHGLNWRHKGFKSSNSQGLNLRHSYLMREMMEWSLVGMKEDTMSSKVVDSKKDDPKVVSCDGQNVLTVSTMVVDQRGINYDSPCVLTVGAMAINTIVCDPRNLIVETMAIDTNRVDSTIPHGLGVSCQNSCFVEMPTVVLLGELCLVKILRSQASDNYLCPRDVIHELLLQALDAYGNLVEKDVSIQGLVPISAIPKIVTKPPQMDGGKVLLSEEFPKRSIDWYYVFPKGKDSRSRSFSSRQLSVVDLIPKCQFELLGPPDQDLDGRTVCRAHPNEQITDEIWISICPLQNEIMKYTKDLKGLGIKVKQREDNPKTMENHRKMKTKYFGAALPVGNWSSPLCGHLECNSLYESLGTCASALLCFYCYIFPIFPYSSSSSQVYLKGVKCTRGLL
eukprot:Gb_34614 [translate_table: standard]